MHNFREFEIAHQGLRDGVHKFEFELRDSFFQNFELSPINKAMVSVLAQVYKHSDMLDIHFALSGSVSQACDRCLQDIEVPIMGEFNTYIRFNDLLAAEANEDGIDDIVYLPKSETVINLSQFLYEYAVLSLPIKAACALGEAPQSFCNKEILQKLNDHSHTQNQNEEPTTSPWDALKSLKNKMMND